MKKVSFQLDTEAAGNIILQGMVKPIIEHSGAAIASRAQSMAGAISPNSPPTITTSTGIGKIKRGERIITTVSASYDNPSEESAARQALVKARDAGRVS